MAQSLTIDLDDDLAHKIARSASERSQPVSDYVKSVLKQAVLSPPDAGANDAILASMLRGFPLGGKPLTRDEIYDR